MTPWAANVRRFGSARAGFGEGAVWSERDDGLWWVDMSGRAACFTSPDGVTERIGAPGVPGGLAVSAGGGVVVAAERVLARVDRRTEAAVSLPYAFDMPHDHIFNDVTVDAAGRLLVGTIQLGGGDDGRGRLFRVAPGRRPEVILDGFRRINGLAFSPDGGRLYVSDSHPEVRRVWRLPYDPTTSAVGPREVFTDFAGVDGRPDGAAVDSRGCYWSAAHDAGRVHCFTPDGRLERSVLLPTAGPTKPAFGGPGLSTMFVTTAGPRSGAADDGVGGALFALDAPAPGCPVPPTTL